MRITLGKKLYLYTSGTVIILLLATFLVLERHQSRQWEEYLRAQSISFARFATPELLKAFRGTFPPSRGEDLRAVFDLLGFNRDLIEFSLHSPAGRLLYRSPRFPDFIDLELGAGEEPDLGERLQVPRTTVRTFNPDAGGRVLEIVTPAFGPTGEHLLSARYLISYDSVDARLAEVRLHFLRLGVAAVLVSLLLVGLVARRVTRPIQELTDGARAIARGDLQTRMRVPAGDEIGALALAFNDMAESLARSRRELTKKNAALIRANEELLQMQEQFIRSERLAAIGQLAAGVSHEIDNPVGIILGYAELLREEFAPDDPRREDVTAIIEECRRCKRITGGLLGLARRTAGQREPVAMNALVEQTLTSLRPQKLFRQVNTAFRPAPGQPEVTGDADELRQVLVNLLLNAAQAMEGRGGVTVDLREEDDQVVLTVADSGPGIPAELRKRIFEPFFSTKSKGEGTGLGLTVCRQLIEEHGGTLAAEEASDGGALFRLVLPKKRAEKNFDNPREDSLG